MFEIARNQEFALSAQLEKSTQKIWKLSDDLNSNAFGIAYHIADVATTGAYEQDFKSVHEWTASVFGIKKSMSYNMLTIGNRFVQQIKNKNKTRYTSIFYNPETDEDFTISQIIAMIPFCKGDEEIAKIKELIESGELDNSFTCKEIKEFLEDTFTPSDDTGEGDGQTEDTTEYITLKDEQSGIEYKIPVDKFDKYAIPVQ